MFLCFFVFLKQDAVSLTHGPHCSFPFVISTYSREGDYITGTENSFVPRDQAKSQDFPVIMVPHGTRSPALGSLYPWSCDVCVVSHLAPQGLCFIKAK